MAKLNDGTENVESRMNQLDDAVQGINGPVGITEEVQDLVWALVDEYITEPQVRRLETLVLESADARTTYIKCIQLHVDLIYFFAAERRKKDPNAPAPFPLPKELQDLMRGKTRDGGWTACEAVRRGRSSTSEKFTRSPGWFDRLLDWGCQFAFSFYARPCPIRERV